MNHERKKEMKCTKWNDKKTKKNHSVFYLPNCKNF